MAFIGPAELDFHFETAIGVGILQEKIQPAGPWLLPFLVFEDEVAKPENGRIFGDEILDPFFIEFRMIQKGDLLMFNVVELCHCHPPNVPVISIKCSSC